MAVIFYDYDELCRVTDCRFRELPQATNDEDEMRAESWFYVADSDVFPETFINFLAFDDAQRAAFMRVHGEILTATFWRGVQQRHAEGELMEVLPYHMHRVRGGEQRLGFGVESGGIDAKFGADAAQQTRREELRVQFLARKKVGVVDDRRRARRCGTELSPAAQHFRDRLRQAPVTDELFSELQLMTRTKLRARRHIETHVRR